MINRRRDIKKEKTGITDIDGCSWKPSHNHKDCTYGYFCRIKNKSSMLARRHDKKVTRRHRRRLDKKDTIKELLNVC